MPSGGANLEASDRDDGSSCVRSIQSSQAEEPAGGAVIVVVVRLCDHCHYVAATMGSSDGDNLRQWEGGVVGVEG